MSDPLTCNFVISYLMFPIIDKMLYLMLQALAHALQLKA